MKPLAFLIIEDVATRHETLWFAVRDIFPDESTTIVPAYGRPCDQWATARKLIEGIPTNTELIVLADLALKGNDPNDAKTGVIECRRLHSLRPDAKLIAVTSFDRVIQEMPDAKGLFALVLNKFDPVWNQGEGAIADYLKEKIDMVRSNRLPKQPDIVESESASASSSKLVFLSHSHADADLASSLVDLVCSALHLRRSDFLCTSVDGASLAGGASASSELRRQIASTIAFVSLLTPKALDSHYVLFELGARWGMGGSHIPLFARGNRAALPGPLKDTVALDISEEVKVIQFVSDLGVILDYTAEPTNAYFDKVQRVTNLSSHDADTK
jgi:hypothetical protein